MNLKEFFKNFFKPSWGKIILVFVLEFTLTFTLLFLADSLPSWQIYLLSPNVFYLESTVNPFFITQEQLSFYGAVSNIISLIYLYFLSCLIIRIYEIGRGK